MKIKPLPDADINLVELKGERPTPHCKKHGAMNKFTTDGIWRCCSTYKWINYGKHNSKFIENNCKAGCQE